MTKAQTVPLKHIALINERSLSDETDPDKAIRYIDIGAVGRGKLISKPETLSFRDAPSRARRVVREGDTIVSTVRTYLRAVWPVTGDVEDLIVSTGFAVITPRQVDPRYLSWWVTADPFIEEVAARSVGVSYPAINASELGQLPVRFPARSEQRVIADYLDTETARIDTLISKKHRLIQLLAEHRTALITQTVTHGLDRSPRLRPSGVDWIGDIPAHWGSPKISHVAILGSGHTPSRSVPEWWVPQECTVPWITTGEVANLRSDRTEYIERTRECISDIGLANSSAVVHPAGTVVLSRTASVGYSGIMATDMATSQDFATWTCGPNLLPRFLLLCLRAMRPDLLGRLTMGSTHKTIYMPDIQSLAIPLPPIVEQHEIVNAVWKQLGRVGEAEDRITSQISLLREYRQALISAAVTGDLATPGLATETPTVRPFSP